MSDRTHYEVLDADPRAPKADLKAAYATALEAAQSSGDSDEVAAVRRAWQILSDPVQRQRYDEQIELDARGAGSTAVVDEDDTEDDEDDVEVEDEIDDEGTSVRGERRALFHHVPEFLEQPTLGRRVTASLIDVITTVALYAATAGIVFALLGSDGARFVALVVLFEIWVVALFVVPTLRTGQTLGKRFTYIMCVDRETGDLPSPSQVLRRYMIPMVAVPILLQMGAFLALFFGLSYVMGRDQLSLADRLAKTVVVIARYVPTRDQ